MRTGKQWQANLVVVMLLKCLLWAALTFFRVFLHIFGQNHDCDAGQALFVAILARNEQFWACTEMLLFLAWREFSQHSSKWRKKVFIAMVHCFKLYYQTQKKSNSSGNSTTMNTFAPGSDPNLCSGLKHGCKMLWVTWLKLFPKRGVLFHPKWKSQKR